MAVQIGGKPDSGFDDPIGMLTDCHRRIERFLGILCRVADRAEGRNLNAEERDAVEAALRYFHESGPRHNSDEEESLFPRLRTAQAAADPAGVTPKIDRLEGEHHQSEALHKESAELFSRWLAEGDLHVVDRNRLRAVMSKLQQIYAEHIRLEEDVVFPCASRLLDRQAVAAIGAEFRARRA
jgi:hemerythrin-like domain-containing protein